MEEDDTPGRVSLRSFNLGDVEHFMTWAGDDHVTQFLAWDTYTSSDDARKFLESVAMPHPWFKAICLNGVPIGSLTLTQGSGLNCCRAELGYVLRKAHWGKGFTTQAVKLALVQGFKELEIERIEAHVYPENKASQKVLVKAGLVQEGLLRKYKLTKGIVHDCLIYSYLKTS
ncbi:hypothetical protein GOP47_0015298 [Adiantum capillus-veneris]|uniref:N-acetyltransferase domain-containing protein n=1 Tax=Adiantum capillus-veneris TaxID=13818 RepID=A0A9D4UK59_ADICA|nr:hypothetical protein GOP47_0015298 [Adiantum capillus-veneris]